jgi:hypothetical protein
MPDKNLCVLSDGTGTFSFFFFPFFFLGGGFIQHTQRWEIVPKPYVGLLEGFVGSLAQDQEKALVHLLVSMTSNLVWASCLWFL